jgi:hypothetical protein
MEARVPRRPSGGVASPTAPLPWSALQPLDQLSTLFLGIVDRLRHWTRLQLHARSWPQQRQQVTRSLRIGRQPLPEALLLQDHRHPVVDRPHELIGVGHDDGARADYLSRFVVLLVLPEPSKGYFGPSAPNENRTDRLSFLIGACRTWHWSDNKATWECENSNAPIFNELSAMAQ